MLGECRAPLPKYPRVADTASVCLYAEKER